MPAWQMYIFLSVFSVYHDTGDDNSPGKHLHNRIYLLSCSLNLLSANGAEVLIFFRQTFQLLFGIRDFPGQRFLLTDCIISLRSVFQLLEG